MYFSKRLFIPLALASLSFAGEDTCPMGEVPVVVVKTITLTGYEFQTSTPALAGVSAFQSASGTVPNSPISSLPVRSSVFFSSAPLSATAASLPSASSAISEAPLASATTLVSQAQAASTTEAATETAILSLSSTTSTASAVAATETFYGVGTRYGTNTCTEYDCWQNGACSFVDYTLPEGIDGTTCVSSDIWNNGANCGGCISVTYKGKTITVMVTNDTGGNATHLDMTPDTYAKLTNGETAGGVPDIAWEWITCPIPQTTPLAIRMHSGSSKYWFAATVENARLRTAKLEVSSDSGNTWKTAALHSPNMWILDGTLPDDTAWVRVTSINGDQVTVENVALKSATVTNANENY